MAERRESPESWVAVGAVAEHAVASGGRGQPPEKRGGERVGRRRVDPGAASGEHEARGRDPEAAPHGGGRLIAGGRCRCRRPDAALKSKSYSVKGDHEMDFQHGPSYDSKFVQNDPVPSLHRLNRCADNYHRCAMWPTCCSAVGNGLSNLTGIFRSCESVQHLFYFFCQLSV